MDKTTTYNFAVSCYVSYCNRKTIIILAVTNRYITISAADSAIRATS